MKVFFRFFRDYPRESILAPLFKLLEACFELLVSIVVEQIVDGGIWGGSGDGYNCCLYLTRLCRCRGGT